MGVVMLSCSPVSFCWATTEQDFSQSYEIGGQGVKHNETYRLPENNSRERSGFLNTLAEHIAELGCDRQSECIALAKNSGNVAKSQKL